MCLSHKSKEKRFEKCEVLRVEHRSENPIQYFLSGEAGRGIFAFLSKQWNVYERIPAFLLSNILILKIVQTLVVLGSGLKNRRQYIMLFNDKKIKKMIIFREILLG